MSGEELYCQRVEGPKKIKGQDGEKKGGAQTSFAISPVFAVALGP